MAEERQVEHLEDEIDLRDYIRVILKRKKVILAVFFVAVITATIVSFLMPKIYETTSVIQIGSIDGLLINKQEAKEILLSNIFLEPIIKELNLVVSPKQLNIKIEDIGDTNLLRIKVEYPDPDKVVKINMAVANSFISQSQLIYQQRLSLFNERLKELEVEVKNVQDEIKRTQDLIAQVSTLSGISQQEVGLRIILLQNTLPNYEEHFNNIMNQRNDLKMLLTKAKDFKVTDFPLKPDSPIKPNKKLNIAISGVVSLFIGIFLAFLIEYRDKIKQGTNSV